MKKLMILVVMLAASACGSHGRVGSPAEFPFPVSLPNFVTTKGLVNHENPGRHEFETVGRKEIVQGRKWSGHVQVRHFESRDSDYLTTLEKSLIEKTGWEIVYRDEKRNPPIATLRRSLGGEVLWISLEGWPDDVTVTIVHRK